MTTRLSRGLVTALSVVALLGIHALCPPDLCAAAPAKTIVAVRAETPPVLDGVLDEPQWQAAPPILDFSQSDPKEGAQPTELTSVRMVYTDHALYVGVICYDSQPQLIVQQLTRRDRSTEADRFTVQIDSYHDHSTAFVFQANVSGVQSDGVLSQNGIVYDVTWDALWDVSTRVYMDGWSAEFEIPFNALRFSRQQGEMYEWGINFRRYISRKHETDEWVMIPWGEKLIISKWGHLSGIANIVPPMNLSIIPYAANTSTFQTSSAPSAASSDHTVNAGLDVKYGLTRNFTLDGTVNPDFGQVEVDQAVLNLTVFETNYPEKRPFFVEGAQVFAFGVSTVDNSSLPLFFSRRIGKRPSGSYAPPSGTAFEKNPLSTTILGAAKVTGHTQSGFSLGAIASVTDEERATVMSSSGQHSETVTEPRGSYNVLRMKQEFGENSWIGGIATLASRQQVLPALSGGLDWNLRFDGSHTLDGYAAAVRSSRGDPAQRDGVAGKLLFARIAAEHWLYEISHDFASRYFNSNDLGFFAQPHDHGGHFALEYRENFAAAPLRRYIITVLPEYRWNLDGVQTRAAASVQFLGEFTNFWSVTTRYGFDAPAYDDAERGIIGTYRRPVSHQLWAQIQSDVRGAVSGSITPVYGFDERGKRSLSTLLSMTIRPTSWIELAPMLYYERTRNQEAWLVPTGNVLDTRISGAPFSVFGDRDVDEADVALRGTITLTRSFSVQFYLQELLARGTYAKYRRLVSSTEFQAYDYRSNPNYINPDFNEITFNANILLRWEYLPGSTVYLVWTQSRLDESREYTTTLGRRLIDTFRLPHEDVLLLKVTYWLPL